MPSHHLKRYKLLDYSKIEDTLKLLVKAKPLQRILICGYPIWVDTDRYENLLEHGCVCAKCGLKGSFAAIEKETSSKDKYHINIYGTRKDSGKHILLTKDHIFPRAMGGLDIMENYQTLCMDCNLEKKNNPGMSVEEAIAAGLTTEEIQKQLAIVNAARDELNQAQQKLALAKEEYYKLFPPRDKSEFK